MKLWQKFTLGAGIVLGAGAIGYGLYELVFKKDCKTKVKEHEKDSSEDEPEEDILPAKKLVKLMDAIIYKVVDNYLHIHEETKAMHSMQRLRLRVPYQKFLDEALTKAEEEICAEKEISREKYLASVKKFDDEKNRDVACRLEALNDLNKSAISGSALKFNIPVDPHLTSETTYRIYRRLLLSHLYLIQKEVQLFLRENEKISKEDKETISENITSIKQERRRQILLENGIALEEDDDPKVELEKAFYYHKITEKKFETKAKELGETFERLEQRIYKGEVIQDLQNDVISMPENEIENISRNLDLKYGLKTFLKEEKEG